MEKLLIEIESPARAKELKSLLSALSFVTKVTPIKYNQQLLDALNEHNELKTAIVKKKNPAMARYL